jgi:hypothetical protein
MSSGGASEVYFRFTPETASGRTHDGRSIRMLTCRTARSATGRLPPRL